MRFKIPENMAISFIQDHFGNEYKLTTTGEYRINSPFIQDKKMHLYISPRLGLVNDFKSGFHGTFAHFVSTYLGISNNAVLPFLIRNYSVKRSILEFIKDEDKESANNIVVPDCVTFFNDLNEIGIVCRQALKYLINRGIPTNNIKKLGYINDPGNEYGMSIFVPFFEDYRIVYFITRRFISGEPRYSNPHNIDSKQFVYNIDEIEEGGDIFIFEGIFDALSLNRQIGTAMLSADLGDKQAVKIFDKAPKNIIVVPDNDETGRNKLNNNIKTLLKYKPPSLDTKIYVYEFDNVKDFNETNKHYIDILECKLWTGKTINASLLKEKFRRNDYE